MPWAELQMHTTANFAVKNRAVNYLFGGLNFQIVHHLFPKISHVHYPKMAEIIKQTANDHNLPFIEHKTFFGAIASHTRVLKKFGTV
jgi:linoleoyl-CoA desaturase